MEQMLIEAMRGQGLPFVMACVAITWIQRMNKDMVLKLNEERTEHLNALGAQIGDLKNAIIECERDRKELWSRILDKTTND